MGEEGAEGLSERIDEPTPWTGREVFDTSGQKIGTVRGRGYPRKRFGATWLLLQTDGGPTLLVPAEQIQCSGERLVLPYALAYILGGPAVEESRPLSPADERRLRFHYGIESGLAPGGCRVGCGLCMVNRRELRRSGK